MYGLYWVPGSPLVGVERWYPIAGYDGVYEVSTFGQVRRVVAGRGCYGEYPKILKTPPTQDGYPTVRLSKDGKAKTFNVHVIVAETFHGAKPGPDYEVDHIDERRDHCCASNLAWVTKYANLEKREYNSATSDEDIEAMAGVGMEAAE
jgi:hypothetical protein